mmetsp:Transcript_21501/g.48542  ORF Transcript_21501/g.48542 Transcript_21501/m.48542 type:complete len:308 (-) Transcript_21501:950-1873(-)
MPSSCRVLDAHRRSAAASARSAPRRLASHLPHSRPLRPSRRRHSSRSRRALATSRLLDTASASEAPPKASAREERGGSELTGSAAAERAGKAVVVAGCLVGRVAGVSPSLRSPRGPPWRSFVAPPSAASATLASCSSLRSARSDTMHRRCSTSTRAKSGTDDPSRPSPAKPPAKPPAELPLAACARISSAECFASIASIASSSTLARSAPASSSQAAPRRLAPDSASSHASSAASASRRVPGLRPLLPEPCRANMRQRAKAPVRLVRRSRARMRPHLFDRPRSRPPSAASRRHFRIARRTTRAEARL